MRPYRQVPSKRLIARLGLHDFDQPAPMSGETVTPNVIRISTRQHVGAPAVPTVSVGAHVEAGQKIGEIAQDKLGAAIHASISGSVSEVTPYYIEVRR